MYSVMRRVAQSVNPGNIGHMTATVDTKDRLADALRVILPLAVADGSNVWLPEREQDSRNVAYAMAYRALAEYDEGNQDEPPAPIMHLLPASATEPVSPFPLAA